LDRTPAGGPRARDLSRLFRPRSIAVIGGGTWGPAVVEQCLKMGFDGDIWPVHPTRGEMHGAPCHRGIDVLPEAPDAAFVGVNRHLTIEIVRALAARGAGGAVCFASGFAEAPETDGDDPAAGAGLQVRLVEAAGDMPVLGPNCYGLINYLDGALLWPDQHGGVRVETGVALIAQSSNMLINLTMQRRGLPLAYCVAAGNQAQTGLAEMAMAAMEDPRVTAVGLHIEGVGDVRAFEAMAARARAVGKPVVALKLGRSEQARAATVSHTASLTGADAVGRALLGRLGIATVGTLPELIETLKLLHVHGALPGRDLCSLSCSGGEAALVADAAVGRGVRFRPLTEDERGRVAATLGPLVSVANPLDYHTFIWGDGARMAETYAAMLGSGFDLAMLILDFPRDDRCSQAAWECAVDAIVEAAGRTGARTAVVATLAEGMPEARAARFLAAGIAPMCGMDETLAAAEASAFIAEAWARPLPAPVMIAGRAAGEARLLDEAEAKRLLAAHGLAIPDGRVAATPQEAANAAEALGFPVALKALGIAHKTEAGAVALGLADAAAVAEAAGRMPGGTGFLVERMVSGGVAELILGIVRDPAHGLALTIGAGGVLAELMADTATLMMPATEEEVRAAIAALRSAPLLLGFRGRPRTDIGAVVRAAMAVQGFASANADRLLELDVNPLIVTPDTAVAADALVRLAEPTGRAPTSA
jgi:acetate---CoA ligase (ADP-forming)